jgi:hypothetical protein
MPIGEPFYLVDEPKREDQSLRTLVRLRFLAERVFAPMGLDAYFAWFVLWMDKKRLNRSENGDIDILAGPLEWNDPDEFRSRFKEEQERKPQWHPTRVADLTARFLAEEEGIKWPPSTSLLVAIEAKCCVLPREAQSVSRENMKSKKTSKSDLAHTRAQVKSLLHMGFDKVVLLDVIGNPPVTGLDGQAWFTALELAGLSREAFDLDLQNRLPTNSPAGHYVWSIGAVVGGDESRRGAGSPIELRQAIQNPFLTDEEAKLRRAELEINLRNQLEALPAPRNLNAVFEDCQKCHQIRSSHDGCKV